MDSSVSQKDQFWFMRVCLHVPIQLYYSEGVSASISAVEHSTSWNPYVASGIQKLALSSSLLHVLRLSVWRLPL